MNGDFAEKLKSVLSDPEALSKISAIASGLGAANPSPPEPSRDDNAKEVFAQSAQNSLPNASLAAFGDRRVALLSSIKPLLREDKRKKIDSLTRALTLAEMMKNLRG